MPASPSPSHPGQKMKRVLALVTVLLLLALAFVGAVFAVSELGAEVVTLETVAADGSRHETRLWIVDDAGSAWLRAGMPSVAWLRRIEAEPRCILTRAGTSRTVRAVPVRDPAVRDRIHARMREKYGWADRFISAIRDGSRSVPVRLVP